MHTEVEVKTYATFREYAPPDTPLGESFKVRLDKGTVRGVIEKLGIPIEPGIIVIVNGNRITKLDCELKQGDNVAIFPQLGGG